MHLKIEHDDMGQKFVAEVEGEECLMAYTMVNDTMHLHFLLTPNEDVAEQLCLAAFNYADKHNLKIMSSSAYIDEIFLKKYPEFNNVMENEL